MGALMVNCEHAPDGPPIETEPLADLSGVFEVKKRFRCRKCGGTYIESYAPDGKTKLD
ncbi:hypothetical protein JCM12141A_46810 [Mycolicibacterium hodleri]